MASKQIVLSVGGRDLRRKELVEERIELLVVVKRHSSVRALYPTHLGGLRAAVARVPRDHERQPLSVGDRLMLVRVRPPPIAAHPTATEVAMVHKQVVGIAVHRDEPKALHRVVEVAHAGVHIAAVHHPGWCAAKTRGAVRRHRITPHGWLDGCSDVRGDARECEAVHGVCKHCTR
eukprot:scaffold32309_cov62-Phaeocystis_antarctica.AAC.3